MSTPIKDDNGRVNLSDVPIEKPINILCHRDEIEIVNDRADVLEITPESTIAMAAKFTARTWDMAKRDEDFKRRLAVIFPDLDIATDDRQLADYPLAVRHVVGLIICTNMAINTNRMPFWKFPETYLHPASQTKLAQLMTMYTTDAESRPECG